MTPGCPTEALTAADGLPLHLTYTYNDNGDVTGLVQDSATKTLETTYEYDALGRLTASSRTDGAEATYVYDRAGNQTGGTDTDRLTGELVTVSATYNPAGQLRERTTTPVDGLTLDGPAKVVVKNTYDKAGNLTAQSTELTRKVQGNSGHTETTTVTAENAYDHTGRLTAQNRSDGQNTAYAYDGLGRSVNQTLPTGQAERKGNGNGEGAGPHQTGCGIGGTTPGCPGPTDLTMFDGQSTTVTFDGLTPIAWATGTVSTNLVYGPAGADHQVSAVTGDAGTGGNGRGCGNGGTTPGCPDNAPGTGTGDGAGAVTVSWLYMDRQGTVRATADSTGATTTAAAYTDYGVLEPAAGTLYAGAGTEAAPGQEDSGTTPALPVATTVTPVGHTGEQINPAAGLNHYHARDYQPGTTRWLQPDPWAGDIGTPATLGKYVYVVGNPTTLIDILGYCFWDACIAEGAAVYWIIASMVVATAAVISWWNTKPTFSWPSWSSGTDDYIRPNPQPGPSPQAPAPPNGGKPPIPPYGGWRPPQYGDDDDDQNQERPESESERYDNPEAIPEPPTKVTGYRPHAVERMELRGITRGMVSDLIDSPPPHADLAT